MLSGCQLDRGVAVGFGVAVAFSAPAGVVVGVVVMTALVFASRVAVDVVDSGDD